MTRHTVYALLVLAMAVGLASDARAGETVAGPVPLSQRTTQPRRERHNAPAHVPHSDRFHVTTVRIWTYRDFLPKGDDSTIVGFEFDSAWSLGRLDFTNISYIELADYPRSVPGRPFGNPEPSLQEATGVTDLLTAFLVSPKRENHGPHHFSAGAAFQFPTASDSSLGSGKWSAGPAIEYEYHKGRFFAAFVALQLWSFAGEDDRKRVNMMMIKPMITYDLAPRWKAVYMPYGISVYWDKSDGNRMYLPLGGGVQYDFCIGRQKMGVSLQFFEYVIRPSKGSQRDLRLMIEFDF